MKKFAFRCLKFMASLFLVLIIFYAALFIQKKETYHLTKKNIIIGDSNTRWSINDSILSNYQNYSTGGETYLFAFTKLKMLDKDNKIDTLLLSFSPHNLINNQWWDDQKMTPLQNRMPYFFNFFSAEDHWILFNKTPRNYLISLKKTGKPGIEKLLSLNREDKMFKFGSFSPVKNRNANDTIFSHKIAARINTIELSYLKKIQEECERKKIKLILIQTPKNYHSKRYHFYDFEEFYTLYKRELKNVDFLDFSKMDIPEDHFWDIYHLNNIGAQEFSSFLKNKKIKNLLSSLYNQKFSNYKELN